MRLRPPEDVRETLARRVGRDERQSLIAVQIFDRAHFCECRVLERRELFDTAPQRALETGCGGEPAPEAQKLER